MSLDPGLQAILELVHAAPPMSTLSPDEARVSYRKLAVGLRPPESLVEVGEVADATVAGADGPLPARVYRPAGGGPVPTVVLFHGGGFVIGDLDTHDHFARTLCRDLPAVVVSVDYRLAPEHRFPAAALDAIAATRDVLARVQELGGSDQVAVAGDSAGGNLSAVVTQHVPGLTGQLLVYPATDVTGDYPSRDENAEGYFLDAATELWFIDHYATPEDYLDPMLSPLQGELGGLPPAVVVTAGYDPLRDEGEVYAEALRTAGVPVVQHRYDDLIHGFVDLSPFSPVSQAALTDLVARFAKLLAG